MLLAFELTGEHDTLPKAEVLACLNALCIVYDTIMFLKGILVIDAQIRPETLAVLANRLGMTHRIYEVNGMSEPKEDAILAMVKNTDVYKCMEKGSTFAVRVPKNSSYPEKQALIAQVGALIKGKGYNVNLSDPSNTFVLLLTEQTCFFCLLLHSTDKKRYGARKPQFRPFFSPGVILPKVARALVNLSGINENELFLDPFCGTGGLLLEAGMIGALVVGLDVQEQMVRGTAENLNFYGLTGALIVGDAAKIALRDNCIDAIATDMPYGRSSLIAQAGFRPSLERLFPDALAEIHRLLKPGGKAVVVSNFPYSRSLRHSFRVLETYVYRVHKSLNRYITVLKKV
ncbi:tRNA (guanine10-N2)-dimethyltransferase [Methanophagales archaeon]|nr:tRNA (guanine10-N2)-dimethyltransferase [Methanophagales archaeon]